MWTRNKGFPLLIKHPYLKQQSSSLSYQPLYYSSSSTLQSCTRNEVLFRNTPPTQTLVNYGIYQGFNNRRLYMTYSSSPPATPIYQPTKNQKKVVVEDEKEKEEEEEEEEEDYRLDFFQEDERDLDNEEDDDDDDDLDDYPLSKDKKLFENLDYFNGEEGDKINQVKLGSSSASSKKKYTSEEIDHFISDTLNQLNMTFDNEQSRHNIKFSGIMSKTDDMIHLVHQRRSVLRKKKKVLLEVIKSKQPEISNWSNVNEQARYLRFLTLYNRVLGKDIGSDNKTDLTRLGGIGLLDYYETVPLAYLAHDQMEDPMASIWDYQHKDKEASWRIWKTATHRAVAVKEMLIHKYNRLVEESRDDTLSNHSRTIGVSDRIVSRSLSSSSGKLALNAVLDDAMTEELWYHITKREIVDGLPMLKETADYVNENLLRVLRETHPTIQWNPQKFHPSIRFYPGFIVHAIEWALATCEVKGDEWYTVKWTDARLDTLRYYFRSRGELIEAVCKYYKTHHYVTLVPWLFKFENRWRVHYTKPYLAYLADSLHLKTKEDWYATVAPRHFNRLFCKSDPSRIPQYIIDNLPNVPSKEQEGGDTTTTTIAWDISKFSNQFSNQEQVNQDREHDKRVLEEFLQSEDGKKTIQKPTDWYNFCISSNPHAEKLRKQFKTIYHTTVVMIKGIYPDLLGLERSKFLSEYKLYEQEQRLLELQQNKTAVKKSKKTIKKEQKEQEEEEDWSLERAKKYFQYIGDRLGFKSLDDFYNLPAAKDIGYTFPLPVAVMLSAVYPEKDWDYLRLGLKSTDLLYYSQKMCDTLCLSLGDKYLNSNYQEIIQVENNQIVENNQHQQQQQQTSKLFIFYSMFEHLDLRPGLINRFIRQEDRKAFESIFLILDQSMSNRYGVLRYIKLRFGKDNDNDSGTTAEMLLYRQLFNSQLSIHQHISSPSDLTLPLYYSLVVNKKNQPVSLVITDEKDYKPPKSLLGKGTNQVIYLFELKKEHNFIDRSTTQPKHLTELLYFIKQQSTNLQQQLQQHQSDNNNNDNNNIAIESVFNLDLIKELSNI
ncbi:hypothetical protein DFA_02960 [Cavenderia fasciculata]|uniref:Uncharacterized protein n=1 Tax=Cavenderia fasciculata TaxID=261658 RepID=F4PG82_CACFS|nr:uncharacterized protein DFA_02960 [Cavenderia fasciculata]EGG24716.1 hypothetical protein DFA_02960 [Cavenderia fasciculata]|eukprot:XP_004362567.1 hypothetical protein DFA_02960 [Cavenderia fasciculata]